MSNYNDLQQEDDWWSNPQKMRERLKELEREEEERKKNPQKRPFEDVESYMGHKKLFYEGRQVEGTMLTVVGKRLSERGPEIVCDCQCGKRIAIPYKTLYYGQAFSCGCTSKPPKEYKPRYDFSGRTYGRLTVLEYKGVDGWECLCRDCQQTEVISSKPGYTYRALLERAGARECEVKRQEDQTKPRWHVKLGFIERGCEESYWVKAYGDTPEEAKANAMAQSDDPRNKIMEISRL